MPEECLDRAQVSYIDVVCFNLVVCGGGFVTLSLGSCCWASAAFCGWITACLSCLPTPLDLRADRAAVSLPCLPCSFSPPSVPYNQPLPDWCGWLSSWDDMQRCDTRERSDALLFLIFLQFLYLCFLGWWRHCFPVLQRNPLGLTYTECMCS